MRLGLRGEGLGVTVAGKPTAVAVWLLMVVENTAVNPITHTPPMPPYVSLMGVGNTAGPPIPPMAHARDQDADKGAKRIRVTQGSGVSDDITELGQDRDSP